MTIFWPGTKGKGQGIKKPAGFNSDRLVIENGLSNFYQNPKFILNAISAILSNPGINTIVLSLRIKITMLYTGFSVYSTNC